MSPFITVHHPCHRLSTGGYWSRRSKTACINTPSRRRRHEHRTRTWFLHPDGIPAGSGSRGVRAAGGARADRLPDEADTPGRALSAGRQRGPERAPAVGEVLRGARASRSSSTTAPAPRARSARRRSRAPRPTATRCSCRAIPSSPARSSTASRSYDPRQRFRADLAALHRGRPRSPSIPRCRCARCASCSRSRGRARGSSTTRPRASAATRT